MEKIHLPITLINLQAETLNYQALVRLKPVIIWEYGIKKQTLPI